MKFVSYRGVKIEDMDFITLVNSLTDDTFFLFMDQGRSGVLTGAENVIDNFLAWAKNRLTDRTFHDVSNAKYLELRRDVMGLITNGLIVGGSPGIHEAIGSSYNLILKAHTK